MVKRFCAVVFTIVVTFMGLTAAARADITQFYGNWANPNPGPSGIRHIVISPAGGNRATLRVYGNCHPGECNWGEVEADNVTAPHGKDVIGLSGLIHFGFAHRQIVLKLAPNGQISFWAQYHYVDTAGKKDRESMGLLRQSDWPGPMSKASWEQPASRDAGWGGGPRGNPLAKPELKCDGFNPAATGLVQAGPGWNLVADGVFLTHTDWNKKTAQQAIEVIRHYRFDHKCHTGTMDFWMSNGRFPHEKLTGASCLQFNSTTAHTVRIENTWRVVDGPVEIFNALTSKDNATAVLAMIRRNHLEHKCVQGWPNPVMIYWLSK